MSVTSPERSFWGPQRHNFKYWHYCHTLEKSFPVYGSDANFRNCVFVGPGMTVPVRLLTFWGPGMLDFGTLECCILLQCSKSSRPHLIPLTNNFGKADYFATCLVYISVLSNMNKCREFEDSQGTVISLG